MLARFNVFFASPGLLLAAMSLCLCVAIATLVRRPGLGRWPTTLIAIGCLLIAIAASEPSVDRRSPGSVTVLVDLSPSTRGATYRNHAALNARLAQLLGHQPYELLAFADGNRPIPGDDFLHDIATGKTRFTPPTSDAVVLFSDGRFELPATGPPTFPVIDPALEEPGDAAVTALSWADRTAVASVDNGTTPRSLSWSNATPTTALQTTGPYQQYAKPLGKELVTATLSSGDRWPENDSLSIAPAAGAPAERWWVGPGPTPAGYQALSPETLPTSAGDYVRPELIVLQNISSDSLSSVQQQRLAQYVEIFGGGLVVVGGDHAFGAGGYQGTPLDTLSPLASSPPEPATQWILLIDGSGSMASGSAGGATPWQLESDTVTKLLPRLPPQDPVAIGSFAQKLTWWSTSKSAGETALLRFPPAGVSPNGPTNLAPVLRELAASAVAGQVVQLLVMSDTETDLPDPDAVADAMLAKKIHLYVLATGRGKALAALRIITSKTGGSVVEQLDPAQWVNAARVLLKNAAPQNYEREAVTLQPAPAAPPLGARSISEWNRTWLRSGAALLGSSVKSPLIASWHRGLGRVTAVAYPAAPATVALLADQIATPARDPRFSVDYEADSTLKITVNAVEGNRYLNGESLSLEMLPADPTGPPSSQPIPQTEPGRYVLSAPAPRESQIATVKRGSQVVERFAVSARYAPEFDGIGNDHPALTELAHRTGGRVIPIGLNTPINFSWPSRSNPVGPELAFGGFAFVAAALVLHRRGGRG